MRHHKSCSHSLLLPLLLTCKQTRRSEPTCGSQGCAPSVTRDSRSLTRWRAAVQRGRYSPSVSGGEVASNSVDFREVFGEQLPLGSLSVGPHLLRPRRPGYDRRHHRLCHKPRYRQLQDSVPPLLGKGLKPLHSVEVAGIGKPTCS